MYHYLPREWLYATNKIEVEFTGDRRKGHGSGFWVIVEQKRILVTNRHVIDLPYQDPKYIGHGHEITRMKIKSFNKLGNATDLLPNCINITTHKDDHIDIALIELMDLHTCPLPMAAEQTIIAEMN